MYHAERLPSVTLSVLWLGGRWWWLGEDIHEIWNECDGGKRVVVGRNGVRQSTVIGRGKTPNWFNHQATPSLGIQLQQWLTWCGEVQSQACSRRLGPDHCRFDKQCYKKSAPPPLKKKRSLWWRQKDFLNSFIPHGSDFKRVGAHRFWFRLPLSLFVSAIMPVQ